MKTSKSAETGADATRVSLRIPARLSHRRLAVGLVSALVEQLEGAGRDFGNELTTAFGEVFNNVVIHGYRDHHAKADQSIEVEAFLTPGALTLRILDTGRHVDFAAIEPPDLSTMPEGGMGVFMIHALVDEVEYRAGSPNVLTLIKRISPSSA